MRYNVMVQVPYAKKLPYTLFAKGSLIEIPHVEEGADYVYFKFGGGTVFTLFYTFEGFRRAYIATGWESDKDGEAVTLPGIHEKLCVLFTARGRKVDRLKRCIHLFTQDDEHKVFSFPLIFWYYLGALIQSQEPTHSEIMHLYDTFKAVYGRKR